MTNKILSIIPNLSYGDFVEFVIINKKLIVANYVRTEQHTLTIQLVFVDILCYIVVMIS
jgi:hypothetical protein